MGSLAILRQPVKEKENSKFKPAIKHALHPAHGLLVELVI